MKKKLVVSTIVGLLFVGASCVQTESVEESNITPSGVVAQPTSWSTFTSPLLEYTMTYPASWNTWSGSEFFVDMEEAESDVDYFSILPRDHFSTISPDQVLIAIDRDTKQPIVPGEAAVESFSDVVAANSKAEVVSNVQALVVDDILPAVQQVEQDSDDTTGEYGYSVVTYIDADTTVYTIHVTAASAADYDRYEEIIQTMVTSFDR